MYPSFYSFVNSRGPVSPEEVAADFLALAHLNGEARGYVERLISDDPRFIWGSDGRLRTTDLSACPLESVPYVVFDLETTGSSARKGAITEVGALKLAGGEVVDKFTTLVNPGRPIEPFVVRLTGITDAMVADAPDINEVLPEFERFVEGTVLVGHNVSFDCGFVTAARGGEALPNPVLDTLKLARVLVPGLRRYRLSALAQHFQVEATPVHRAFSDAAATAEVFLELLRRLDTAGVRMVREAVQLRARSRAAIQMRHMVQELPAQPGVYYFLNKKEEVLYVGKAKDLRARVRAHFSTDEANLKTRELLKEAAAVKVERTQTELQALTLEAREINRLLPPYNIAGIEEHVNWYIRLDLRQPYPVPERAPEPVLEQGVLNLGPYSSGGVVDGCIEALSRIFPLPYCAGDEAPCVYGQMGRCAACSGMGSDAYHRLVVREAVDLLRGEGGQQHIESLVRERDRLAGLLQFEAAASLRDLVIDLERARLMQVINDPDKVRVVLCPCDRAGYMEAAVFTGGNLLAHKELDAEDSSGLISFATQVLDLRSEVEPDVQNAGHAWVAATYLSRCRGLQVVSLRYPEDLPAAVRRVLATKVSSLT